jgi:hypothetical protein
LEHDPSDLNLPCSKDYRHEPPAPRWKWGFFVRKLRPREAVLFVKDPQEGNGSDDFKSYKVSKPGRKWLRGL